MAHWGKTADSEVKGQRIRSYLLGSDLLWSLMAPKIRKTNVPVDVPQESAERSVLTLNCEVNGSSGFTGLFKSAAIKN